MKSLFSKTTKLLASAALTSLSIVAGAILAPKVSAEMVTSREFPVSLNTNNGFSRIDGYPRMSVYASNPNDGDQQFDRIGANGAWLMKHRTTGACLNAHYLYQGAQVNVYPCNCNDVDQLWDLVDKGNGYVLYRRRNTNLCLTANTPVGNSSVIALQNCAYGGPNGTQDWIGSLNPNSPFYGGGQSSAINYGSLPRTGGATGQINNLPLTVQNFSGEYRNLKTGAPTLLTNPDPLWIYGGIQGAEFCNANFGIQIAVNSKFKTSPNLSISRVDYKLYSRIEVNYFTLVGVISPSSQWRDIIWGSSQRTTDIDFIHASQLPLVASVGPTPVKISTHIILRYLPTGAEFKVIDEGGVIDFGNVSPGNCNNFNRTL